MVHNMDNSGAAAGGGGGGGGGSRYQPNDPSRTSPAHYLELSAISAAAGSCSPDDGGGGADIVLTLRDVLNLTRGQRRWTVIWSCVSLTAIVLALTAMYWEATTLCYIVFLFPLILSPYSVYQRRQLNKQPTLQHEVFQLRITVDQCYLYNHRLMQRNADLRRQVQKSKEKEEQFEAAISTTGASVADIKDLVSEYGSIQRKIRQLESAAELDRLMTAIFDSDINQDAILSPEEWKQLEKRLQVFANHKPISETALRQAWIRSGITSTTTSQQKQPQQPQPVVGVVSSMFRVVELPAVDEQLLQDDAEMDGLWTTSSKFLFGYPQCED